MFTLPSIHSFSVRFLWFTPRLTCLKPHHVTGVNCPFNQNGYRKSGWVDDRRRPNWLSISLPFARSFLLSKYCGVQLLLLLLFLLSFDYDS